MKAYNVSKQFFEKFQFISNNPIEKVLKTETDLYLIGLKNGNIIKYKTIKEGSYEIYVFDCTDLIKTKFDNLITDTSFKRCIMHCTKYPHIVSMISQYVNPNKECLIVFDRLEIIYNDHVLNYYGSIYKKFFKECTNES
jgi:hypothetical protein